MGFLGFDSSLDRDLRQSASDEMKAERKLAEKALARLGHKIVVLHDVDGNEIALPAYRLGPMTPDKAGTPLRPATKVWVLCDQAYWVRETPSEIANAVNALVPENPTA